MRYSPFATALLAASWLAFAAGCDNGPQPERTRPGGAPFTEGPGPREELVPDEDFVPVPGRPALPPVTSSTPFEPAD